MAFLDRYRSQVALLIRILPFVAEEPDFALKGGTAINLFVRDMPRLSVDIDLTYLPVQDRKASLAAIDAAMKRIAALIERGIPPNYGKKCCKINQGCARNVVQSGCCRWLPGPRNPAGFRGFARRIGGV